MPSFPSLPSTKWHVCVYKKEQDTLWWRFLGQVTVSIELCNYSSLSTSILLARHLHILTISPYHKHIRPWISLLHILVSYTPSRVEVTCLRASVTLWWLSTHTVLVMGHTSHPPSVKQMGIVLTDSLHFQLCVNILALITCKPRRYLTNTTHL